MSSLERRRATNISTLPTSQLASCTDSTMLSASLSVTADDTSSHFASKAVLQLNFRQLSKVQDGFIVATNLEDVVDHPSNLFARK